MRVNKSTACVLIAFTSLSVFMESQSANSQRKQIELELVLAIDTSSSIDESDFELQKQGVAEAFRHPDVLNAIESCGGDEIAVAVMQWSGNPIHLVAIDWMLIRDQKSAAEFAASVEMMPRRLTGFTGLGGAIRFAVRMIEENHLDGRRKIIDISGNGIGNGLRPDLERDRAISKGATINGLAILGNEPNLDQYYAAHVIGGTDAFVINVVDSDGFVDAFRTKLRKEIHCPKVADAAVLDGR